MCPSRIALRLELLAPTFPRSGGRPADGFTTHGAAIDPLSLVVVSSPCVLGDVSVAQQGCGAPRAAWVNDLAGTMQPELLPIGRTPLGKSRGLIHDFRLPVGRSVLQQTAHSTSLSPHSTGFNVALAHAVTASKNSVLLGQHKREGASKLQQDPSSCTPCLALRYMPCRRLSFS